VVASAKGGIRRCRGRDCLRIGGLITGVVALQADSALDSMPRAPTRSGGVDRPPGHPGSAGYELDGAVLAGWCRRGRFRRAVLVRCTRQPCRSSRDQARTDRYSDGNGNVKTMRLPATMGLLLLLGGCSTLLTSRVSPGSAGTESSRKMRARSATTATWQPEMAARRHARRKPAATVSWMWERSATRGWTTTTALTARSPANGPAAATATSSSGGNHRARSAMTETCSTETDATRIARCAVA